jgi:3-phosphoshikimate 1-carboxyvinyltransferase
MLTIALSRWVLLPYRQSRTTFIERDWTAASYWYEVLTLGGREGSTLTLQGLLEESTQGDRRVADIFGHLGVQTTFVPDEAKTVVLTKRGTPDERLDWDFVETPDLAQTVVVTCCLLGVPFHFTGLQSLRIKETDRIAALQNELRKLGFSIEADDRQMWWTGTAEPQIAQQTAAIDTYKDHRMAMAFAPAALRCGGIVINDPLVVSKSYPAFWQELRQIGLNLTERRS